MAAKAAAPEIVVSFSALNLEVRAARKASLGADQFKIDAEYRIGHAPVLAALYCR
ncbi:MAG: hypothetical protein ACOX30_09150 [Dethiobacteria bacterium]